MPEVRTPVLVHGREKGRTQFIAFERAFSGRTMGALSVTADAHYREPFAPLLPDVAFVPANDVAAIAGRHQRRDGRDRARAASRERAACVRCRLRSLPPCKPPAIARARCSSPTRCSAASDVPGTFFLPGAGTPSGPRLGRQGAWGRRAHRRGARRGRRRAPNRVSVITEPPTAATCWPAVPASTSSSNCSMAGCWLTSRGSVRTSKHASSTSRASTPSCGRSAARGLMQGLVLDRACHAGRARGA